MVASWDRITFISRGPLTTTGGHHLATRGSRRNKAAWKIALVAIWIALVCLVLLWQSANYESVMSVIAEWQFNAIGRYYPALSYLLVVLALTLPAMFLFRRPRPPRGRALDAELVRSTTTFSRALFGLAGAIAVLAVGILLSILRLPDDSGPLQDFRIDAAVAALPHEGLTRLTGAIAYERTTALDENLLIASHKRLFAPILAPNSDPSDLQFFVELSPTPNTSRGAVRSVTGVLQRGGLPGEIIRLYRYSGHRVEEPYFVLFRGTRSIRWARFVIAGELVIAALLVAALGLWQRFRSRRLLSSIRAEPAREQNA